MRSRTRLGLGATAVAGCAAAALTFPALAEAGTPAPHALTAHAVTAQARLSLDDNQRYAIDEITNFFENGDLTSGFADIQDYGDGCGYTAGYIGFCTQTQDDVRLVSYYDQMVPNNPLAKYLPALRKLADAGSAAHTGLGGFPSAWRSAAKDPRFVQAQFDQAHRYYLAPALAEAKKVGLKTALGAADFFDTAVEMGPDGAPDSPDGLLVLVAETDRRAGGSPATGVNEKTWLADFQKVRIAHLRNPRTPGRKSDWPDSVDRVQALQQMAAAGEYALPLPLRVGADFDVTIPVRRPGDPI